MYYIYMSSSMSFLFSCNIIVITISLIIINVHTDVYTQYTYSNECSLKVLNFTKRVYFKYRGYKYMYL